MLTYAISQLLHVAGTEIVLPHRDDIIALALGAQFTLALLVQKYKYRRRRQRGKVPSCHHAHAAQAACIHEAAHLHGPAGRARCQFNSFTSTKVHLLTQKGFG